MIGRVFIRHIFVVKPLLAVALLVCLGTMLALFRLNRRQPQARTDQFLIAFLALMTIYEGIKVLKSAGVVLISTNTTLDDGIELLVALLCLAAALILRIARDRSLDVESALRLAHAAPIRAAKLDLPIGRKDSMVDSLGWALPRLSDGAFKLFVVLSLRSELSGGPVPFGITDLQLKVGKSKEELQQFLTELENAGAVSLDRDGGVLNIGITAPARWIPQPPEQPVPAFVSESQT